MNSMETRYDPREPTGARKLKAKKRIEDKTAVLEQWFQKGGPPAGVFCPRRIGEFLAWEDESIEIPVLLGDKWSVVKGVYKVTAVTADKPENKALKTRVLELMEKLATASKPFAIRKEARQLKAALDEARVALQNVTNRYVEICDKVQNLEEDSKIKQNEIQNLMEEKKRLTEELAKIKAFPKLLKKGGE